MYEVALRNVVVAFKLVRKLKNAAFCRRRPSDRLTEK
jgi:hypothetical protein